MILAIDTETTGVDWHDEAFMISMAWGTTTAVCDKRELTEQEWQACLDDITNNVLGATKIIFHNAKFDIQKLCRLGIPIDCFKNFEDTQAIAHLLNEHQPTGLKSLARTHLGETTDEDEVLKKVRRELKLTKDDGYYQIPSEILSPYAKKDAEFTLRLYQTLYPRLGKDQLPLYELEKELTMILLQVEAMGMAIDVPYVQNKRREYGDKIYLIKEKIAALTNAEFNPQSPKQVIDVFAGRGVTLKRTDKSTLVGVGDELATLIVELREANKIKTTYFDALNKEVRGGVLHPNFRQHGTVTGRMSSGIVER